MLKRKKIISILNINLFEDLLALVSKKYLDSIKKARKEYKEGKILKHKEAWL